jgi:L-alanine-DL-glutamate epimerase-like enolase superfamily enzyme
LGIKKIEVYCATLRNKEPFRISAGTTLETRNVILKVTTDYDVVGWGESSPSKRVTGETSETVIKVIDSFAPKIIGMCPLRIEQVIDVVDSTIKDNPAAKASVDMALYDILGKTVHKPLFMLLGGFRTEVLTDMTMSIKSPNEMAKDASDAVRKGFKAIKVKVGLDPDEDVERVKLIREAVGCGVQIRIDANQGWTTEQAIYVLNKIEEFDVQFVEQPVQACDIEGLKIVRKNSPIPVMADESVHSPADAMRLIKAEAVDLINIKLMKCGGILRGKRIAEVAEAAKVPCMIGCMSESSLGIAAAAHLAAGTRNIKYADLDSDLMQKDKLVKKGILGLEESNRVFPASDGLGVEEMDEILLGRPLKVYS